MRIPSCSEQMQLWMQRGVFNDNATAAVGRNPGKRAQEKAVSSLEGSNDDSECDDSSHEAEDLG